MNASVARPLRESVGEGRRVIASRISRGDASRTGVRAGFVRSAAAHWIVLTSKRAAPSRYESLRRHRVIDSRKRENAPALGGGSLVVVDGASAAGGRVAFVAASPSSMSSALWAETWRPSTGASIRSFH